MQHRIPICCTSCSHRCSWVYHHVYRNYQERGTLDQLLDQQESPQLQQWVLAQASCADAAPKQTNSCKWALLSSTPGSNFSTMDSLVPITMTKVAKFDKQSELQNRESSDFWTHLASAGSPVGMLVSVSCFVFTQILMREMPFSCQARNHSALCEWHRLDRGSYTMQQSDCSRCEIIESRISAAATASA
jgi:hypothetical protein